MFRTLRTGAVALLVSALPALAADVTAKDAYAISANPKTGAAFMVLRNAGAAPARVVAAEADIARRVELHTHLMEDGIARMRQVDAIEVPAGGETLLERGGLHVMFMGLAEPMTDGETFPLSLVLETGETVDVEVTVDLDGKAGGHGHGD